MNSKLKYLFLLGLALPLFSSAQNPFEKRIKPVITCFDITYNAFSLVPDYYHRGDLDSLLGFVNYWEKRCGKSEYSVRTRTLLEIERRVFNGQDIDDQFFQQLTSFADYLSWKNNIDTTNLNPYRIYHDTFDDPSLVLSFDTFTSLWARDLLIKNYDICSDTRAVLELYSEHPDAYFGMLKEGCPNSQLSRIYRMQLSNYRNLPDFDWGFIAEYWMPQGNASLLGNQPGLGMYGGLQTGKWLFDLTLLFRFTEAENNYTVIEDGLAYDTDHFFGGYIGADIGYQLVKSKKSRLYALSGIAFDGFDTLPGDDDEDPSKSINSLNLNVGLGYRHFLSENFYIGLEARQNFVNYNNRGGTDLSGNTQSIRLLFGFMQNLYKDQMLKKLKDRN